MTTTTWTTPSHAKMAKWMSTSGPHVDALVRGQDQGRFRADGTLIPRPTGLQVARGRPTPGSGATMIGEASVSDMTAVTGTDTTMAAGAMTATTTGTLMYVGPATARLSANATAIAAAATTLVRGLDPALALLVETTAAIGRQHTALFLAMVGATLTETMTITIVGTDQTLMQAAVTTTRRPNSVQTGTSTMMTDAVPVWIPACGAAAGTTLALSRQSRGAAVRHHQLLHLAGALARPRPSCRPLCPIRALPRPSRTTTPPPGQSPSCSRCRARPSLTCADSLRRTRPGPRTTRAARTRRVGARSRAYPCRME